MISSTRPAGPRRTRFAALLERPDDAGLREAAGAAARSEAAARDLGLEADRAWPRLSQAERDLLRYHVRAAGVALALERATQSLLSARRARAAAAIGELRLSEASPRLAEMLHDRNRWAGIAAARALGRIGSPFAAQALLAALEKGLVPEQRLIEALGGAWAAEPLLLAFRAPRTVALRVPLADALGRTGSPAAAEVLAAAMPAASVDLRVRIVRALARLSRPHPVRAAMSDPHGRVRAQAAWALGRLGDREASDLLEAALLDSAPWVRANSAAALRRIKDG
ncbi:MAG TPA: HEAT repeat domain-containing protein [Gaiellales bacterium]